MTARSRIDGMPDRATYTPSSGDDPDNPQIDALFVTLPAPAQPVLAENSAPACVAALGSELDTFKAECSVMSTTDSPGGPVMATLVRVFSKTLSMWSRCSGAGQRARDRAHAQCAATSQPPSLNNKGSTHAIFFENHRSRCDPRVRRDVCGFGAGRWVERFERRPRATMKLTTYHMTMTSPQGVVEAISSTRPHAREDERRRNDRCRQNDVHEASRVWTKYPGVDVMQTQTDPLKAFAAKAADYQVDDLGMKLVDGATLHAYRTTNLKKKYLAMMYIDGSGRIVRMETGTMVMVMSKFGEAVTIVAPM